MKIARALFLLIFFFETSYFAVPLNGCPQSRDQVLEM